MSIGPPPFETKFEAVGRGMPDPAMLEAINKECLRENWNNKKTMVVDHATGIAIPSNEFKRKYPDTAHDIGHAVIHGRSQTDEKGHHSVAIASRTALTY